MVLGTDIIARDRLLAIRSDVSSLTSAISIHPVLGSAIASAYLSVIIRCDWERTVTVDAYCMSWMKLVSLSGICPYFGRVAL
jgi:hypothetical protein